MIDYKKLGLKYMRYNDKPYVLRWTPVGKWIEYDNELILCECSVCHEKYNLYEEHVLGRKFCPNCGAMMVKEGDAE